TRCTVSGMMVSQLPAISPANKTKTCRHANRLSAQAAKVELFREWAEEADREPENFRTALAAVDPTRRERLKQARSYHCSPAAAPAVRPGVPGGGLSSISPPAAGQPTPPAAWMRTRTRPEPLWRPL